MALPKLRKVNTNRPKKKKILLLSDDLRLNSGIATMSKQFVLGTVDTFDWVQLGAALNHPDHGKVLDASPDIIKESGCDHASVKIYAHTGYGNPQVLREIMQLEKPDAILHFTDPRFWGWLYHIEHEIRQQIPIFYYAIWDCPPSPRWNFPFYASCDLIMGISKQSHQLHKDVLEFGKLKTTDLTSYLLSGEKPKIKSKIETTFVSYAPHGINENEFYPIDEDHPDWPEYKTFHKQFREDNDVDYLIFWNNRNVKRKQPGDVILAYKAFCDKLTKKDANRCALLMHTDIVDVNGTDLMAVKKAIAPDYKVLFSDQKIPTKFLNYYYNIADVTLNIASNEGFGLSSAESIMAGTVVVNNVTGGLQDQIRFVDDDGEWITFDSIFQSNHVGKYRKHGVWAKPVFPSNRSLQGSTATPYIFDDRASYTDIADAIMYWYENFNRKKRKKMGLVGRAWLLSKESGMSAKEMSRRMKMSMEFALENFRKRERFELIKVEQEPKIKDKSLSLV